jgi:hypothetical protein
MLFRGESGPREERLVEVSLRTRPDGLAVNSEVVDHRELYLRVNGAPRRLRLFLSDPSDKKRILSAPCLSPL